ncbi:MAG: LCP family protein [Candidatus Microsaccharimonas sp.]
MNKVKKFFRNKKVLRRASIALAVILVVTYILAAYAAFTTNIIPGKYLGALYLVSFLATAAIVYFLVTSRIGRKLRLVLLAAALVGSLLNIYMYSVGVAANAFLQSTQQSGQSYEEYSIVALKAKNIALATPNQATAILSSEPTLSDVQKEASKKTEASYKQYDNPTTATMALQDGGVEMAIFKSSYIRALQEQNNNELYQSLQVLATFKVLSADSSKVVNGDVSQPFVVYISGIDTYGEVSKTSRSDVNMLVVVNPKTHKILLVNTPRDYYVQLHGTTGVKDKLTHAGLYGIDMSEATLEDLYDVDINYNVRINFSSLVKIVDTLGGVTVDSEYNFSSDGYTFTQGKNTLNGAQALAFSRNRHAFTEGDRTRGQNQQRVLTAIINKLNSPATVVNFQSILGTLQGSFQTNMSNQDISELIRNQLDSMAKWTVTSTSVDGTGASDVTYSMGNQKLYVMVPDQTSLNSAKNAINSVLGQ